jgi:hypothetical protein
VFNVGILHDQAIANGELPMPFFLIVNVKSVIVQKNLFGPLQMM